MIHWESDYRMLIGGEMAQGEAPPVEVYNPANRRLLAHAPNASRDQLDRAVAAATNSLKTWRRTSMGVRQGALRHMAQVLEDNSTGLARVLTLEQGKPLAAAKWEIQTSVFWLRELAAMSLADEVVEESPDRRVIVTHEPLGVVAAITPWNFPVLLSVWKVAPALLTGNTVLLKPSPFTPLCTLKIGELFREVLPPGVFNVLTGTDRLGGWMTHHAGISKIAFTGSTDTGRQIMSSAATTLKRITLELGGNDAAIVLPDVDPGRVAPMLFWGAFQNTAQFCNAIGRLYVHDDVFDEVLEEFVRYASTIKIGDGLNPDSQLGPLQNEPHFHKIAGFIEDCRRQGYTFALGGEPWQSEGLFAPITIIDRPPDSARVVTEEVFGPVLPILRWSEESDVVNRANSTRYGLGASVWGANLEWVQHIGSQLEAGTVWQNEIHQYSPRQPAAGHKESGVGCENSLHGLREYTNRCTRTLNRVVEIGRSG